MDAAAIATALRVRRLEIGDGLEYMGVRNRDWNLGRRLAGRNLRASCCQEKGSMKSVRLVFGLILAVLLIFPPTQASAAPCYHYVNLVGKHPAAWWHGYTGVPALVDYAFPGVATGDWGIPFGAHL